MDRTNPSAQSHIGEERVAARSREDHDGILSRSVQVNWEFDADAETAASARRRDSNHHHFVTCDTASRAQRDGCELENGGATGEVTRQRAQLGISCHPFAARPARNMIRRRPKYPTLVDVSHVFSRTGGSSPFYR